MASPSAALPERSQEPAQAPAQGPRRVLLDASCAPMLPAARETMLAALDAGWADTRRLYAEARQARGMLDQAREVLADGLGVRPAELSFLPSGPDAVRAGIEGLRYAGRRRGARMVASAVEHSCILVPGRFHAAQSGDAGLFEEVPVTSTGRVELAAWERAVSEPGTTAAALQSANGEVGTRQPLPVAYGMTTNAGVPLMVDAMASLGRDPVPSDYDVLAGDARSFGGPPGLGLLVVPERTRWRRPGPSSEIEHGRTDIEPVVALALAAAEAWRQSAHFADGERVAAHALVQRLRRAAAAIRDVEVVGEEVDRLPHVLTFSALFADGEALVSELDRRGFAVASGSACTASTLQPSHVLAAIGVLTHGNVRVTLPLQASAPRREADVERFMRELPDAVRRVRAQLGAADL